MVVENIMYFLLGVLLAGLVALIVLPAVWRRAVRLTTKRIEAATPITMAEFRADKDQLRAEFALQTRRLEMNIEALRRRLADQLREINRKKAELGTIKGERDNQAQIVRELEEREAGLRDRIIELERENADLAQRLRMREREVEDKVAQLAETRELLRDKAPKRFEADGKPLSGDYNQDVAELLQKLEIERKRSGFLETQNRTLIAQLEAPAAGATLPVPASSPLPAGGPAPESNPALVAAEAHMADAENRVATLLEETAAEDGAAADGPLLAEQLSRADGLEQLRRKVAAVEAAVAAVPDGSAGEPGLLRAQLIDIAADVSRLAYSEAKEADGAPEEEESLFERVQRFAAEGGGDAAYLPEPAAGGREMQAAAGGASALSEGEQAVGPTR